MNENDKAYIPSMEDDTGSEYYDKNRQTWMYTLKGLMVGFTILGMYMLFSI